MAKHTRLKTIFLSASIPLEERDPKHFGTADVIAIRDAVTALATVIIPNAKLVWGGHPAITPVIRYVTGRMNSSYQEHVVLYQSEFFRDKFPKDNDWFRNVVLTANRGDQPSSILEMRSRMFAEHAFDYGIFIGGMEGVEDEFGMMRDTYPNSKLLPVASTGAAARIVYDRMRPKPDERLATDYAYMALFKDLIDLE